LLTYELDEFNWLICFSRDGRSSILADEIRLGNTVQAFTIMRHIRPVQHIQEPYHIVAPLARVMHWQRTVGIWTDFDAIMERVSHEFMSI
jgi:SNF2 family DNA or RNA helicase